jgi:hypothetical protein
MTHEGGTGPELAGVPVERGVYAAVVDTNVLLEIFSAHDVLEADVEHAWQVDRPKPLRRRARARDALLLAMCLHRIGARTYSLRGELTALIQARVPPGSIDDRIDYVDVFRGLVRPTALWGWKCRLGPPDDARGTDADDALIEFARAHGLPLITNEGIAEDGTRSTDPRKIPRKALLAGVSVLRPGEFFADKIDTRRETSAFLAAMERGARDFVLAHRDRQAATASLSWIGRYYRKILDALHDDVPEDGRARFVAQPGHLRRWGLRRGWTP